MLRNRPQWTHIAKYDRSEIFCLKELLFEIHISTEGILECILIQINHGCCSPIFPLIIGKKSYSFEHTKTANVDSDKLIKVHLALTSSMHRIPLKW